VGRVIPGLIGLLALILAVALWLHSRTPAEPPAPHTSPDYDDARAQLAALPVKGWDRQTDFSRYRFGEPWSDDVNVEFGHNGCNTRDDILRRDLTQLVDAHERPSSMMRSTSTAKSCS